MISIPSIKNLFAFFFMLTFLFSCKQVHPNPTQDNQVSESLESKIAEAVAARKIPRLEDQKVEFTAPHWIEGRGPHSTEIFSHLEDYIPTIAIKKGDKPVNNLPVELNTEIGQTVLTSNFFDGETTLDKICAEKQINGIIILHEGKIVYEQYPEMSPEDHHFLGSVSKSFVGTVIALLADEGKLHEQDNIEKHLVEFKGKPLGQVTIEQLLRMASAINCREHVENRVSFTDPNHCFYKILQHLAMFPEPESGFDQSLMELLADSGMYGNAGEIYDYTSANTMILTSIAERIGNKPFHELVQDYIWSRIGAEDDASVTLSSTGVPGSPGTMLMRLRDLARYGLALTDDDEDKIASDRYMTELHKGDQELFRSENGTGQRLWLKYFEGQGPLFQSYHWDVVFEDGDFTKFGLGGQGLYVSPGKHLVIAFFSANKDETRNNNNMQYLVRSVALSDHFN